MCYFSSLSATLHRITTFFCVAYLLLIPIVAFADPPSCDDVNTDPSLLTCTCLQTNSDGSTTVINTPNRCGDMLSGQRILIEQDDLVIASPKKTDSSPLQWVSQNLVYQTMPLASDPNVGDFNRTPTTPIANHPGCQIEDAPPTPQRTRMGRLFDTPNDYLITLTAPNGNTGDNCNVTTGNNLDVHVRNTLTGDKAVIFGLNTSQAKWAQIVIEDFNRDGFDDILILTVDKIVIATAKDVSTPTEMMVHETALDLSRMKPLNELSTGDFNGDGLIDVTWIGGAFDASDTSDRGNLTLFFVTVCPGNVSGDALCDGASSFDVIANPAAGLAPNVTGATSNFSLLDLPGAKKNSARLEPNICSNSATAGGLKQSLRAGAVTLGNFDQNNGLGVTGLPIDELIVAFVAGNEGNEPDPCLTNIWLFTFVHPTDTSPSWALPVASQTNLFPEAPGFSSHSGSAPVITLHASTAQLDWQGPTEQAVIGIGGGIGIFSSSSNKLLSINPSYLFPVTVSVTTNPSGDQELQACGAPDRSRSSPTKSGDKGSRYLWGTAVGRFTSTMPSNDDTSCTDPSITGECPYDPQIATFGAEINGFTGSGNQIKLWSLEASVPNGSSSQTCANRKGLTTSFLPVAKLIQSVNSFPKLDGAWDRAGSMLQVGDLRGNSIRLGDPTIIRLTSHSQPIAMLQAPPTHIDFITPVGSTEANLLNLSAAPDQFNTSYQDSTSTMEGATHQTLTSTSFSNSVSVGGKVAYSEVPFLETVTVQDQTTITDATMATTNKSLGQYETQSFSLNVATGIRDAIRWQASSMNVFHYPVIGSATCPGNIVCSSATANNGSVTCDGDVDPTDAVVLTCNFNQDSNDCECQTNPEQPQNCPAPTAGATTCTTNTDGNACCTQETSPLNYVLSGPEEITQKTSPGSVLEWYQPVHASGQLFSYPASVALAQQRFGRPQSTSTPPADLLTKEDAFDTGSGSETEGTSWQCKSVSSASVGNASNFSYENQFSVTAGSSDKAVKAGDGGQVSFGWDLAYSSSHSTLNSSTFTQVDSAGVVVNVNRDRFLTPLEDYSYGFTPFLFGAGKPPNVIQDPPTKVCPADNVDCSEAQKTPATCEETGPLIAGYSADMTQQQASWWGANYVTTDTTNGFDLALTNPERWQLTTTTTVDSNEQFLRCRGAQPALECAAIQAPSAPPTDPSNPTSAEVNDIWTNSFYSLRGLLLTVNATLGPQRNQAVVGDTVFLSLRVFNFSLAEMPQDSVAMTRFYRQKVDPTFDKEGDVIGLQSYIGAPEVIMNGSDDFVSFEPPPSFGESSENFVFAQASYVVDQTEEDSYWIYWVTIWLEDGQGNVLSELPNHGLASEFSPTTHYPTISEVPILTNTEGSSFSNNLGMFKQTFYIAKASTSALGITPPHADSLSIRGFHATPLLPRPFSPVVVAADLFSHGAATDGVTVLVSELGKEDLALEVEHLTHVRADSSHFFRKAIRPQRCGPFTLLAEAHAADGLHATTDTSFIVPCELEPQKFKGSVKLLNSEKSKLRISAQLQGETEIDLSNVELTVESLLDERGGGGELVDPLASLNEKLVLMPDRGATPINARFTIGETGELRIFIHQRKKGRIDLLIEAKKSRINAPEACSGDNSQVKLVTSLLLNDASDKLLRLYFDPRWRCDTKLGRLVR